MTEKTMRLTKTWKGDSRPAKGNWLPGKYCSVCPFCGEPYIGDCRSRSCADCAYDHPDKRPMRPKE